MKWETRRLADMADLSLGKMLDERKNSGEPRPYLANVNVRWGSFDLDNLREMRFEENELDRFGLRRGDIVMCEGGEPGRCAIWKDEIPGMMIQKAIHRIRPHSGLDHRFLYYSLLHQGRSGSFAPLFTGSTIKHLPKQQLEKVEIVVPPLPTQQQIAELLSPYDDLIENNLRRIALLEEAARLLYREWFVRLRFPGHEHTRMVDGVPEGWDPVPLEEAMFLQRGFDLPRQDREEGDIPVYASTGPNGYHSKAMVKGPGVVTGRSGTLGVVHYIAKDFWPLNTALWVREFRRVSPIYAFFLLRTLQLDQYNGGVSVPTLDRKVVHRISVLIPPPKIIRLFDEQVAPIFTQNEILTLQNQKLKLARDLLLPRLMRGEIAV